MTLPTARFPLSFAALLFAAVLLSAAVLPGQTDASTGGVAEHAQTMTYQIYVGGINAVEAELDVAFESRDEYDLALNARTRGFLGTLVPWQGTFSTAGWRLGKASFRPQQHQSVSTWRDETETKTYSYGKDGRFKDLTIIEEGRDESPESLEDDLTHGTTDALSATLQVMQNMALGKKCEGTSEVFDGKRRFKLSFSHQQDVDLAATRYNVYEGEAAECIVEVTPVSGAWHSEPRGWLSIQEQGREKGTLPTLWMAQIDDTGPAVPVKMRMKTEYGVFFMHLVEYKNGDKVITAEKSQ